MLRNFAAEFTKRSNWSQLVLEGLRDFLHVLTSDGRILYASPSCKAITGFERTELEGRFVSAFIHPEDYKAFVNALSESTSSCDPVRFIYRFRKADWEWVVLEASGHAHVSNNLIPSWPPQGGFFMMARPYFSNNTTLFDSFLEHKVENERLLARRAELKYEDEADQAAEDKEREDIESDVFTMYLEACTTMDNDNLGDANRTAPPQMISITSDTAPTQLRLPQTTANDNEGMTSTKPSSQMVDVVYLVPNKAQDTRTSNMGRSFRGDVGIQISMHGSNRMHPTKSRKKKNKKKQHLQILESYICGHCSTLVSPEWRKGPNGPKTLCNACGLRWSKETKNLRLKSEK